jgi:hypothetical protein
VDLIDRVCAAYTRQRALGHHSSHDALCCVVRDECHPQLWAANHVSAIRARTHAEIAEVMQRAERAFAHCEHRLFVVDPLTPAPFVAALAQDDYNELTPTILLSLEGRLRRTPRELDIRLAASEQDWAAIERLVAEDHSESARRGARCHPTSRARWSRATATSPPTVSSSSRASDAWTARTARACGAATASA